MTPSPEKTPLLYWVLLIALSVTMFILVPAVKGMDSSQDTFIRIHCDVPGKVIEAGETVNFDLLVVNAGTDSYRKMWTETFDGQRLDWKMRFMDGPVEVNRLSLQNGGTRNITFVVDTSSDTPVGDYTIRTHIGDGWYWLYITIAKSHAGEKGSLELNVVDKDGEKVKGATIELVSQKSGMVSDRLLSAADGSVSTLVDDGMYTIRISKPGYKPYEKKDLAIKGGITTKAGTIMLEKSLFAADLSVKSPVITTTVGKNPSYDMVIKNIGKSDDTFRLASQDTPEGWYVRFRESPEAGSDVSEIYLKSGDDKALVVEAIPPYGVPVGDYNFSITAESSGTVYSENLSVKIRGNYEMKLYSERYQYDVSKGEALTFPVTVSNSGNAGALTNVHIEVSAPDGWKAEISPKTVASIQHGEKIPVSVRVIPPANIVASEYKITVTVTSDQTEKSDDYHIVVKEQSLIAVFGIAILVIVGGGVFYLFRKYKRR
jgi:uncharacterized membrane protein